MYKKVYKRIFDIIISGFGLLILLPFFIIITPIVAIAMKGNPFFVQERPGKNGKIFKMIKYRSMTNTKNEHGVLLPDKDRLTKFGRLLRKTSIDELPELWNVFIGDMSIIGPRPLSPKYLPHHTVYENKRYAVKPGITGWAQINGRSGLGWEERFWYDVEYVNNISFSFDVKIFFRTIYKVLKRADVVERADIALLNFNEYRQIQLNEEYKNKEIGSEFWTPYNQEGDGFLDKFENKQFVFSGRVAIDIILKDLIKTRATKKVLLPDYLCQSILSPIQKNGVDVEFYSVVLSENSFDIDLSSIQDTQEAALFICDYFFFNENYYKKLFDFAKEKGMPIIHDITHSLLSQNLTFQEDDYYFASLRKWIPVLDGAIVGKKEERFSLKGYRINKNFVKIKLKAMELKRKYILFGEGEKEHFLGLYKNAEDYFDKDIHKKTISKESLFVVEHTSFGDIIQRRIENSQYLASKLREIGQDFIYNGESCPLFLPIILNDKAQRDNLQKYMIDRDIFLPIHWKKLDNQENTIYNKILSLVIDQRYTIKDMSRIVDGIKRFLEE